MNCFMWFFVLSGRWETQDKVVSFVTPL